MTATHTANGFNFLLVEVPEDIKYDFHLAICGNQICADDNTELEDRSIAMLPKGNWQIHCIADEAGEWVAEEIVEQCDRFDVPVFKDYEMEGEYQSRPTDSLLSLTRSLLPNAKKVVVLKEIF